MMRPMNTFQNNTFWTSFYEKLSSPYDSKLERIQTFSEMIEDVILDFKFNKDATRANALVSQLEAQVNKFFDSLLNYEFVCYFYYILDLHSFRKNLNWPG